MKVSFTDKKLGQLCNRAQAINKKYGPPAGQVLQQRLRDLRAFETLADVPTTKPFFRHELKDELRGQVAVDLFRESYRIVLRPIDDPPPRIDSGALDYENIDSIIILRIENYHKK